MDLKKKTLSFHGNERMSADSLVAALASASSGAESDALPVNSRQGAA